VDESKTGPTLNCWHCGRLLPVPPPGAAEFEKELPEEFLLIQEEIGYAVLVRQAMERKIRVTCGSCGRGLTVPFRMAGKKARCPACSEKILIPHPEEEGEAPEVKRLEPAEAAEAPVAETAPAGASAGPADSVSALAGLAQAAAEIEPEALPFEALARAAAERERDSYHGPTGAEEEMDRLNLLATWTAPANGHAASAELTEAVSTALPKAVRRAKALQARRRMSLTSWAAVAAILLLAIGAGLWVGKRFWSGRPSEEGVMPGTTPPTQVVQQPGPTDTHKPSKHKPPKPEPPKPEPPQPAVPTCTVVAAWTDPFVSEGYSPARPKRIYRKVSASVDAGDKPVSFKTYGPGVSLSVGQEEFTSLGSPGDGTVLAMGPRRDTVDLKPGESLRVTFLFDVPDEPASFGPAKLRIRNVADADVPGADGTRPRLPSGSTKFVEASPRNLRPLLQNPIMAAIQTARNQTFLLRSGSEQVAISIPEAAVVGTATPVGAGCYSAQLKRGEESLECTLRVADQGNRLILYLDSEPFHEMTYVVPGWKAPTEQSFRVLPKKNKPFKNNPSPRPDKTHFDDEPRRPDRPSGEPTTLPNGSKKYMPDIDPRQKSIFEF